MGTGYETLRRVKRTGRTLPKWLLGGSSIAIAIGLMNVATYAYTMVAARVLGPRQYGAFASLMATLLVISVLQLGLQATAARRISADPGHVGQIEDVIMRVTGRAALAVGAAPPRPHAGDQPGAAPRQPARRRRWSAWRRCR